MENQIFFKDDVDKDCLDFINKFIGWETFLFLKNYYLTARHGRMELASLCLENFRNLQSGKYDQYFNHIQDKSVIERKKEFVSEFLQIDLLSKTMMLIEDLSTISSALEDSIKKMPKYIFDKSSFKFINNLERKRVTSFLKIFGVPNHKDFMADLTEEDLKVYQKVNIGVVSALRGQYENIKGYKDKYYHFYLGYKHSYSRIFAGHKITKEPRVGAQELLQDAKAKKFGLVLVYKIDRFSRNLKDLLNLVDELSACGVGFKSATEPFDTTTSAGKLMFQQLGSFAEFERNRIAERVFPGMLKGVQQGNWQGARYSPYGYRYNKANKLLEVDEIEVKVVKIIFEMCLAGKSIRFITEYLTKKKYRNRKGNIFSTKLIGDILKNRIYTGKLVWNRHHYDKNQKTKKGYAYVKNSSDKIIIAQGKHEAIISEEDFSLAQEKLKLRRVEIKRKRSDYPLSGILYCAKCNHRYLGISSISNHRTNEKKRWYRCAGPQRSFIRCKNKSVKAENIEPKVAALLDCLLRSETLRSSRWTTVTTANFPTFDKISKVELEKLKNRLKTNYKKQSKLTDAYLENLLSEELYKQKNKGLRQEEEELQKCIALQELREIERERSKDYLNRVEEFVSGYNPGQKELSLDQQKQVAQLLFKNIKIARKGILSFSFFAPFNSFFFEAQNSLNLKQNQGVMKKLCLKSILRHSADPWIILYKYFKPFLFTVFNPELLS